MTDELRLIAPPYLYLPGSDRKHYLSFNNYHSWPIHTRTALRRAYSEVIKAQVLHGKYLFRGEVSCTVTCHPPQDDRVRDTDDHCFLHAKWANDALKEAGVWEDDNCVLNVQMLAGATAKVPHVTIHYKYIGRFDRPISLESVERAQSIQPTKCKAEVTEAPKWGSQREAYPKKRSPKR